MSRWITFEPLTPNLGTKRWAVMTKERPTQIGTVSWWGPWRKYVFHAGPQTLFDQDCLRDIADFVEAETKAHYAAKSLAERQRAGL